MTIYQIVRSPAGGIRKHVMDLLQYFIRRGDRVVLVTNVSSGDDSFKKQVSEEWFQDVRVIHLPIRRNPHPTDLIHLWKLFRLSKQLPPDVVHGHGAKGGMYARVLGGRRASVYSPHGGSLHANYGTVKNGLYQFVERQLLPFTGKVVVESRYTHNQFRKLVCENFSEISINYNGIDFPDSIPEKKGFNYHVAALGLLRPLKGFDLLIRAAAELKPEFPQLKVKISGRGDAQEELQQLIERLDLKEQVELTGEVSTPEETYRWADVVVVPSRYESFGLVALESMAQGVPVIVSHTGGLLELVTHGENGRIFTRNSSKHLAQVLKSGFDQWKVSEKMAMKAFEVAKNKYTKEHMLSGLEKIYSQMAKR